MITLATTGRHYDLDAKITKYLDQKIGRLDKYLPRGSRDGLQGKVVLELDKSGREDNQCVCEVKFEVKGELIQAREATVNMYAAIDICEQKLKAQVLKYKSKHEPSNYRGRKLFAKLWTPVTDTAEVDEA